MKMASPPIFSSLEELSQGSETNRRRYHSLVDAFEKQYGKKPECVARAPGRVNLIGEHIDYCGYGVLPMAIEEDVAIACRCNNDSLVRFANVQSDSFPYNECSSKPPESLKTTEGKPVWYNYFLCGYKGVVERYDIKNPVGMDLVISGSVPAGSGLSSSSAFVCCAALLTAHVNRVSLPSKHEFAVLCAQSERHIGTEGGGMDQAISFLGEAGTAKMVEFNPLKTTNVVLPDGVVFVVANTLVSSEKAASDSQYNLRVVECRLAAQVIAKVKGGMDWRKIQTLRQLSNSLGVPPSKLTDIVSDCLHEHSYTQGEICDKLGISVQELQTKHLNDSSRVVAQFELYKRAKHVFTEASRVIQFRDAANKDQDDPDIATKLGQLMNDSHGSCRDLYECSCQELDELVAICKDSGALGSRLTGAGWGGCTVSLVRESDVEDFKATVAARYYDHVPERKEQLKSAALFATKPGPGAAVCNLN